MRPRSVVVRTAFGRVDRAVDLHVRGGRLEGPIRSGIDRQAEAIADEERLRSLRLLLRPECAGGDPNQERCRANEQSGSFHVRFSLANCGQQGTAGATVGVKRSLGSILVMDRTAMT